MVLVADGLVSSRDVDDGTGSSEWLDVGLDVGFGVPAGDELPTGGEVSWDDSGVDGSDGSGESDGSDGSVGSVGSGSVGSEGPGVSVGFGPGSFVGWVGCGRVVSSPLPSEVRGGWLCDGVSTEVRGASSSSVVVSVVDDSEEADMDPVTATPSITTVVSAGSACPGTICAGSPPPEDRPVCVTPVFSVVSG